MRSSLRETSRRRHGTHPLDSHRAERRSAARRPARRRRRRSQPGPGHYYVAPSWNGAKVSIKGRLQHKDEADRSPGFAYHPDDRATSPRKRDPAFSFGSSTRPPLAGKLGAVPGPGAYGAPDVRKTARHPSAPAFSIQARVWMPDKREDSPGPIYTPAGPRPGGVSFGLKPDVMIGSSVKNDVFLAGTSPARAGKALGPGPGQYPVYVPKPGPAFRRGCARTRTAARRAGGTPLRAVE